MTWSTPSLSTILDRVRGDIGPAARLKRSVERGMANAITGISKSLHGHLAYAADQAIPASDANAESTVKDWASFFGVDQKQPTKGTTRFRFPATSGRVVPIGTAATANGVRFIATEDTAEDGGFCTVPVATEEFSSTGNQEAGGAAYLVSPIAGVTSAGVVLDDVDGTDLESVQDLNGRLRSRLRAPPRGGNENDYDSWAKATPGVKVRTTSLLRGGDGPGTMVLVVAVEGNDPAPSAPQLAALAAYVGPKTPAVLRSFRVAGAVAEPISYNIQYAPYPSPAVETAIAESLAAFHLRAATINGGLLLSQINEAISTATGETDHVLVSPAANVSASTTSSLLTLDPSITFGAIP